MGKRKTPRFKGVFEEVVKDILEWEGERRALEKQWREEVKKFNYWLMIGPNSSRLNFFSTIFLIDNSKNIRFWGNLETF